MTLAEAISVRMC